MHTSVSHFTLRNGQDYRPFQEFCNMPLTKLQTGFSEPKEIQISTFVEVHLTCGQEGSTNPACKCAKPKTFL